MKALAALAFLACLAASVFSVAVAEALVMLAAALTLWAFLLCAVGRG